MSTNVVSTTALVTTTYTGMNESVWLPKLVGFSSNGSSVMQGKQNGVDAKLKEKVPGIQAVRCFAHRLELSFKDAIKSMSLHSHLETLLCGLYKFYHLSLLNRSMLKRVFKTINESPRFPTRIGGVCWVAHMHHALTNFWLAYGAVVLHMEQVSL